MRKLILPALAALIVCAVLVALGVWQLDRLAWKETLIAQVFARLTATPVAAPAPADWPRLDFSVLEYQSVTVSGKFLNTDEAHVIYTLTAPKGKAGGLGYLVMTPLATETGWIVYVNRGFVPRDRKNSATRPEGQIEGETTVTGLLRRPADRSWFMPGDNATGNEWFSRDPALYSTNASLPSSDMAPYIIDANFDPSLLGGLPQGGETIVDFPNNHLGYAITWFGLALCCAGVFLVFARGRLRESSRGKS